MKHLKSTLLFVCLGFAVFACGSGTANSDGGALAALLMPSDPATGEELTPARPSAANALDFLIGAPTACSETGTNEFHYETGRNFSLAIRGDTAGPRALYTIYTYDPERNSQRVASGAANSDGEFAARLRLPGALAALYIMRRAGGRFQSQIIDVTGDCGSFDFREVAVTALRDGGEIYQHNFENPEDVLYGVNGQGDVFVIDPDDYTGTKIASLPETGSITNAIDVGNRRMYFQQGVDLWYMDLNNGNYHEVGPLPKKVPRMEYNANEGLLYMGWNDEMYLVDPLRAIQLAQYDIDGIESPNTGGDLKFAADGTLYLAAFSGLYRLGAIVDGEPVQATRISGENLPFNPTSLTIDSDGILYLGENSSNAKLIAMSTVNGDYAILNTYDFAINDLTTLPRNDAFLSDADSDGDGVPDYNDAYPDDADRAADQFTPSQFGYGTVAFEDLWPNKGDYDFNDLVVNYRFIAVQNAAQDTVSLKIKLRVKAIGAAYRNGFAIELPVAPERVASVTGSLLSRNIIQLNANGTEAGQSKAVIPVFDDASRAISARISGTPAVQGIEMEVVVDFVAPVSAADLGTAPFNPFLIVNGNRAREVHLQNHAPTDLAAGDFGSGDDDSLSGVYYRSATGHPWAIDIMHDFKFPLERVHIESGYNHFRDWVESAGEAYADWYTDGEGRRNTDRLYLPAVDW